MLSLVHLVEVGSSSSAWSANKSNQMCVHAPLFSHLVVDKGEEGARGLFGEGLAVDLVSREEVNVSMLTGGVQTGVRWRGWMGGRGGGGSLS